MTPEKLREIEELYHAVREASAGERASLLGRADLELRQEVESLIAHQDDRLILDGGAEAFEETATALYEGTLLGPYQLTTKIGQGGMGEVFRAVDTRLGRPVAIKIAAERYNERFQMEALAISRLNHPHVCTLYDVGPNYLVMELIEGSTLAGELKKGPLNPETAARFGAEIAGALAEAHSLGILHRDLKPSNIMVTRHGIKVLDFGLAKISSEKKEGFESSVTVTGAIMGTPAYLAPEQVEGREPGSFTDLFALGLVIYEMSVGRLPFPGASLGQMLSSGSNAPVPAPSRERAGVPTALDSVVAKLLEKDPAKRPAFAADVARELSAIADRIAAPPSHGRWRGVYAAVAVVFALSLAAWMVLRSREGRTPASSDASSYRQLTSFTDAAVWPTLSADGHGRVLSERQPVAHPRRHLGQAASKRRADSNYARYTREVQSRLFSGRRSSRVYRRGSAVGHLHRLVAWRRVPDFVPQCGGAQLAGRWSLAFFATEDRSSHGNCDRAKRLFRHSRYLLSGERTGHGALFVSFARQEMGPAGGNGPAVAPLPRGAV
jgi:serine/threonine protein kinase